MSPFSLALEKKKFFQRSLAKHSQKPFVVIWHSEETSYVKDVIDALSSLQIPYVLKSAVLKAAASDSDLQKADMVIFFRDEPSLYALAAKNLCVPVAPRKSEKTKDYNAVSETGNGFYFNPQNKWEVFASLIRACETFQFPYDWENLLREVHRGL